MIEVEADETLQRLQEWAGQNAEEFDRRSARIAVLLLERWRGAVDEVVVEYLDGYDISLDHLATLASGLTAPLTDQAVLEHVALASQFATSFGEDAQQHAGEPGGKWMVWTAFVGLLYIRLAKRRGVSFGPAFAGDDAEMIATYEMLAEEAPELSELAEYRELLRL